jgi:uncharacterized protein YcaQ
VKLSLGRARRMMVAAQGLDGGWRLPRGKEGVAQAVERLAKVQIDTIAVVERAHHHILWSRRRDYAPRMLHALQARDRRVFEYWAHAASYLPIGDYRFYLPRMRAYRSAPRIRAFLEANEALVANVLARIRSEGGLRSADFDAPPGSKFGTWWDWKPAKRALEALYSVGELMVSERRGFQRVYDLPERVLPSGIDASEPDPHEVTRFFLRQLLRTQGISALQQRQVRDRGAIAATLRELVESGEVTPVEVDGVDAPEHYALTELLERAGRRTTRRRRLHILSPFDAMVIRRDRLERFFSFDFRLEAYTPEPKRRYGYFCLPILWGDRFVGRLDPKAERAERTLVVRKLLLESGARDREALWRDLAAELTAFASFNDCDEIRIEDTHPRSARSALRRTLREGRRSAGSTSR